VDIMNIILYNKYIYRRGDHSILSALFFHHDIYIY